MSFGILKAIELTIGLRVPVADEIAGIDVSQHGEQAYHGGDIGDLVGVPQRLGESVVLPARELRGATATLPRALAS
jgi:Amt family ammonium transporter